MLLSQMTTGQKGLITKLSGSGPVRQRLLEMGLTPGTEVEVIRFAPLGDPMEIEVRRYRLSIRKHDAGFIEVEMDKANE